MLLIPGLFHELLKRWGSPYLNQFTQPDSIIPNLSNPQSWNRYSYVTNRPVNFNDPTGHAADQGGGGGGPTTPIPPPDDDAADDDDDDDDDHDDETALTLSRDELDVIEDQADQLGYYHGQWGQLWGWGVGAIAGVAMLGVDFLSCAAAVGSGGTLTGGCIAAIYLTVFAVPAAGIIAGYYGGGIASADSYEVSSYVSEALSDNPELDEFNITFKKSTSHTTILPGGVGPTFTNYTVQMTGMDSPIVLSGYAGDDIISALFGVTP